MLTNHSSTSFLELFKNRRGEDWGLEGYPLTYCNHILGNLRYYSSIYSQVIDLAIHASKKPISELTVLDYGAGNGFLGMFAKHAGFKKVWMNDLSEEFITAAKKTSQVVNIKIDDFIIGDLDVVLQYFKQQETKPALLLSTDVIEHIYDLNQFFSGLKQLNPYLIHIFTTASNPYNFLKVRKLRRMQMKDEWIGYKELSSQETESTGYSKESFLEQRQQIIQNNFPHLSQESVINLAKQTRGKRKADILLDIKLYMQDGQNPIPPKDPFWVCDPETGSWTERILPLKVYENLYQKNNFAFHFFNGLYNRSAKSRFKGWFISFLNKWIINNLFIGKFFAPYILFLGIPFIKK